MSRMCRNPGELNLSGGTKAVLILLGLLLILGAIVLLALEKLVLSLILFAITYLYVTLFLTSGKTARMAKNLRFGGKPPNIHPEDVPLNPWDNLSAPQEQKAKTRRSASKGPKAPWEE